ncbi:MAG: hypothetical protein Q8R14_03860 [Candidatus Omnitrophota bacterium]|nr:hypothetical protein [Candidatus Omnitrophota bacterium]
MKRLQKIVSTVLLFAFLLNTCGYDLSFAANVQSIASIDNLSIALKSSDILGNLGKGKVEYAIQSMLQNGLKEQRFDLGDFKARLTPEQKDAIDKGLWVRLKKNLDLPGAWFECWTLNDQKTRAATYYVNLILQETDVEIKVYTEDEFKKGQETASGDSASGKMPELEMITLKNGATEIEVAVRVVMMSLDLLIQQKPIVFYELVMKARDPNHKFFGRSEEDLMALSLVERDGELYDITRNIVLSAVEGEDLNMRLVSPIAESRLSASGISPAADRILSGDDLTKLVKQTQDWFYNESILMTDPRRAGQEGTNWQPAYVALKLVKKNNAITLRLRHSFSKEDVKSKDIWLPHTYGRGEDAATDASWGPAGKERSITIKKAALSADAFVDGVIAGIKKLSSFQGTTEYWSASQQDVFRASLLGSIGYSDQLGIIEIDRLISQMIIAGSFVPAVEGLVSALIQDTSFTKEDRIKFIEKAKPIIERNSRDGSSWYGNTSHGNFVYTLAEILRRGSLTPDNYVVVLKVLDEIYQEKSAYYKEQIMCYELPPDLSGLRTEKKISPVLREWAVKVHDANTSRQPNWPEDRPPKRKSRLSASGAQPTANTAIDMTGYQRPEKLHQLATPTQTIDMKDYLICAYSLSSRVGKLFVVVYDKTTRKPAEGLEQPVNLDVKLFKKIIADDKEGVIIIGEVAYDAKGKKAFYDSNLKDRSMLYIPGKYVVIVGGEEHYRTEIIVHNLQSNREYWRGIVLDDIRYGYDIDPDIEILSEKYLQLTEEGKTVFLAINGPEGHIKRTGDVRGNRWEYDEVNEEVVVKDEKDPEGFIYDRILFLGTGKERRRYHAEGAESVERLSASGAMFNGDTPEFRLLLALLLFTEEKPSVSDILKANAPIMHSDKNKMLVKRICEELSIEEKELENRVNRYLHENTKNAILATIHAMIERMKIIDRESQIEYFTLVTNILTAKTPKIPTKFQHILAQPLVLGIMDTPTEDVKHAKYLLNLIKTLGIDTVDVLTSRGGSLKETISVKDLEKQINDATIGAYDNNFYWINKPGTATIENTTLPPHPKLLLLDAIEVGGTRAIEKQEKEGQRQLANSEFLPVEGTSNDVEWAAIGVKLGQPKAGDPLFRHVTLPPGWKIVPTDHDMWSNLVDDKGRVRAEIFYKAAVYDRRADVRLLPAESIEESQSSEQLPKNIDDSKSNEGRASASGATDKAKFSVDDFLMEALTLGIATQHNIREARELYGTIVKETGPNKDHACAALLELAKVIKKQKLDGRILDLKILGNIAKNTEWNAGFAYSLLCELVKVGVVTADNLNEADALLAAITEKTMDSGEASSAYLSLTLLTNDVMKDNLDTRILNLKLLIAIAEKTGLNKNHAYSALLELAKAVKRQSLNNHILEPEFLITIVEEAKSNTALAYVLLSELVKLEVITADNFIKVKTLFAVIVKNEECSKYLAMAELVKSGIIKVDNVELYADIFEKEKRLTNRGYYSLAVLANNGAITAGNLDEALRLLVSIAEKTGGRADAAYNALSRLAMAGVIKADNLNEAEILLVAVSENTVHKEQEYDVYDSLSLLALSVTERGLDSRILGLKFLTTVVEKAGNDTHWVYLLLSELAKAGVITANNLDDVQKAIILIINGDGGSRGLGGACGVLEELARRQRTLAQPLFDPPYTRLMMWMGAPFYGKHGKHRSASEAKEDSIEILRHALAMAEAEYNYICERHDQRDHAQTMSAAVKILTYRLARAEKPSENIPNPDLSVNQPYVERGREEADRYVTIAGNGYRDRITSDKGQAMSDDQSRASASGAEEEIVAKTELAKTVVRDDVSIGCTIAVPNSIAGRKELETISERFDNVFKGISFNAKNPADSIINDENIKEEDRKKGMVIALVTDEMINNDATLLDRLKNAKIRFLVANDKYIEALTNLGNKNKDPYLVNTLGIMLLALSAQKGGKARRLFGYYLQEQFELGSMTADEYINAIMAIDIEKVKRGHLKPYDTQELVDQHNGIAQALMAA